MRQQKCSHPAEFCDACNGFGYVTSMPNLDMPSIEALVKVMEPLRPKPERPRAFAFPSPAAPERRSGR